MGCSIHRRDTNKKWCKRKKVRKTYLVECDSVMLKKVQ